MSHSLSACLLGHQPSAVILCMFYLCVPIMRTIHISVLLCARPLCPLQRIHPTLQSEPPRCNLDSKPNSPFSFTRAPGSQCHSTFLPTTTPSS